MPQFSTEILLFIFSGLIVLSYLYQIISTYIRIPSVLLLLATGITLRLIAENQQWGIDFPQSLVEFLGVIGLIMIVLEAGLDLKLGKEKMPLIRKAFFASGVILIISITGITTLLHFMLDRPVIKCLVYAIPLSILGSSIVIPSLQHLSADKKEFLVYEASFSDITGLLVFNYFTGEHLFSAQAAGNFFLNIILAALFSIFFSILLFLILTKARLKIKFFLVLALLIILYEGGKLIGIPSLLIILVFGILMNNWKMIKISALQRLFSYKEAEEATQLLHSLTAETSFLVKTFFFIFFGFSIDIRLLADPDVILIGSIIVCILFIVRFFYLKFFLRTNVYPETFFIPRGLITVVLFYKIPEALQLHAFNGGILFFVIIVTTLIMMTGMIFYKKTEPELNLSQ